MVFTFFGSPAPAPPAGAAVAAPTDPEPAIQFGVTANANADEPTVEPSICEREGAAVGSKVNHSPNTTRHDIGGDALDETGPGYDGTLSLTTVPSALAQVEAMASRWSRGSDTFSFHCTFANNIDQSTNTVNNSLAQDLAVKDELKNLNKKIDDFQLEAKETWKQQMECLTTIQKSSAAKPEPLNFEDEDPQEKKPSAKE